MKDLNIINCTPHPISIMVGDEKTTFQPSGILPRVGVGVEVAESIGEFPCIIEVQGEVEGLPESKEGTFYIVSGMVFSATNRKDVIAPDTGKSAIRSDKGFIEAVRNFKRKEG